MKFKIECRDKDSKETWWEEYDKEITDATEWGESIIKYFNDTLRQGEKPRVFVQAIVLDINSIKEHTWRKTNLFTIMKNHICYDTYECKKCGITSKRYGLNESFQLDTKYKYKVYLRCDTSKTHLDKKQLKNIFGV